MDILQFESAILVRSAQSLVELEIWTRMAYVIAGKSMNPVSTLMCLLHLLLVC